MGVLEFPPKTNPPPSPNTNPSPPPPTPIPHRELFLERDTNFVQSITCLLQFFFLSLSLSLSLSLFLTHTYSLAGPYQGRGIGAAAPSASLKGRKIITKCRTSSTRQVYNLFQDLQNKFFGFIQRFKKGGKNGANLQKVKKFTQKGSLLGKTMQKNVAKISLINTLIF